MRTFFIGTLDVLISIFVVLMIIGVVIFAANVGFGGGFTGPSGQSMGGGPIAGLFVLVVGLLYVCFMAGFMYLGLGIYHNTRRTAEALEQRAL